MTDLEDFDILLFSGHYLWPSYLIEWAQGSPYSHIGIVLKKPTYLHPKLTGIYLLESGREYKPDCEDGKYKFGVQLTELNGMIGEYNGNIYKRKLVCDKTDFHKKFKEIHTEIYDKPYDDNLLDIMRAETGLKLGDCQIDSRFFCSALVTFVYMKLGLLPEDIAWSIIEPKAYSDNGDIDNKLLGSKLENVKRIK